MAKCAVCDGPEHPAWKAHIFTRKPSGSSVVEQTLYKGQVAGSRPARTTTKRKPAGGFDRVKYQREYMRKRRAR